MRNRSVFLLMVLAICPVIPVPRTAAALEPRFEPLVQTTDYAERLARLRARAAALVKAIQDVDVKQRFCDVVSRNAVGRELAQLRAQLGDLERDWGAYKQDVSGHADAATSIAQWGASSNPKDPNFWTPLNKEVVDHARDDLKAQVEEFAKNQAVNCDPPRQAAPPPPAPEPPKADPLAGLKRPEVKELPPPVPPKFFCSEEEKLAWLLKYYRPWLDVNSKSTNDLRQYRNEVEDRLDALNKKKPVDAAAVAKLQGEIDWAMKEHKRLDDEYFRVGEIIKAVPIVNCNNQTGQQPSDSPRPDSGKPRPTPGDSTKPKTTNGSTGALPAPAGSIRFGAPFIRLQYERSTFPNFRGAVADQPNLSGSEANGSAGGYGFEVGGHYRGLEFALGRHFCSLHFNQRYRPMISNYSELDGRLDGSVYNFSIGHYVNLTKKVRLGAYGSALINYDKLVYTDAINSSGAKVSLDPKTLTLGAGNFGARLGTYLGKGFEAQVGGSSSMSFGSRNVDKEWSLNLGLQYQHQRIGTHQ